MKKLHLFTAAAIIGMTVSGSAMARTFDSSGQNVYQPGPSYLIGITQPDPIIASARVTDRNDNVIGAVQSVSFDDRGHAVMVEVALLNRDRVIRVNADHFLYDPDNNALIASIPFSG